MNNNKSKTYKVQEILKRMEKFKNETMLIKGETKEFEINFNQKNIPHLLGLHYMETKDNKISASEKIKLVFKENISDQEILEKVNINNGIKQKINVKNRIESFDEFMNNLEKGIIVEKTLKKGDMKVNYLIVQSKDDNFYHLGILAGNNGAIFESFEKIEVKNKDIPRTYFIEDNIDYFEKTQIMEEVKSISKYSDDLEEYIPFSFDENKNRALIEEFKKGKDFDYKEFLKENFDNKEQIKSWNTKNKESKDDFGR